MVGLSMLKGMMSGSHSEGAGLPIVESKPSPLAQPRSNKYKNMQLTLNSLRNLGGKNINEKLNKDQQDGFTKVQLDQAGSELIPNTPETTVQSILGEPVQSKSPDEITKAVMERRLHEVDQDPNQQPIQLEGGVTKMRINELGEPAYKQVISKIYNPEPNTPVDLSPRNRGKLGDILYKMVGQFSLKRFYKLNRRGRMVMTKKGEEVVRGLKEEGHQVDFKTDPDTLSHVITNSNAFLKVKKEYGNAVARVGVDTNSDQPNKKFTTNFTT